MNRGISTAMAVKEILLFGDKNLQRVSRNVEKIDDDIKNLINDLRDTLRAAPGIGLAAPQIGALKKVVIIDMKDGSSEIVLINPKIVKKSGKEKNSEGCLSYPGFEGIVERPKRVVVKALNINGEEIEVKGEGLLARALCHEIDHLDGVLYIDKAKKIYRLEEE